MVTFGLATIVKRYFLFPIAVSLCAGRHSNGDKTFLLSILLQTPSQYRIYCSWRLPTMDNCQYNKFVIFYINKIVEDIWNYCQMAQWIFHYHIIEPKPCLSILLPSHSLLYQIHSLCMRNTTTSTAFLQSILSYLIQ